MSVRLMTWVWDHSPYEGARLLVHLGIADHANDQGIAWPSQETLAVKARCSVEWVRQTIADMQKRGLLEVTKESKGRGNPIHYRLVCAESTARKPPTPQTPKSEETPNSVGSTPKSGEAKPPTPSGAYREPTTEPSHEPSSVVGSADDDTPRADVEALCEQLATAVRDHRGGEGKPSITKAWRNDMRLLVDRGPLGVADPQPIPPEKVRASIRFLFAEMAVPNRSGFCWADQIRSPHALREHWHQLAQERRRMTNTSAPPGSAMAEFERYRQQRDAVSA